MLVCAGLFTVAWSIWVVPYDSFIPDILQNQHTGVHALDHGCMKLMPMRAWWLRIILVCGRGSVMMQIGHSVVVHIGHSLVVHIGQSVVMHMGRHGLSVVVHIDTQW